jgi:methionyl-tRNA synthetase
MPRHLITSALPYINGVKHLGNLVGSMLPGDAYARYLRARGEEVLYICATDEHGTPAELAAAAEGLDVAEFCRIQHERQRELGERFMLSFDHFGRSSSPQNHDLTKRFARRLEENGYIEERSTEQMYSPTDGRFLPDRYVIGTCPHCGYPRARGDQCENCTRLLDPTQLIDPRSAISGATDLELRESRHLFLLQSKLVPDLRRWLDTKPDWPILVRSIAQKWLDEGLEDRSITRDLSWGVPVDRPGFEGKVYYVWFDAPIEYIAATAEWAEANGRGEEWRGWWYESDDVVYSQFMAKDNVPFHTVGFPCTIIGAREPWHLVDYLKAFNWLTYEGGKFSTSENRGVFMDDALDLLPADYWRYYLLRNAPESDDSDFTWEHFAGTVNKDLADTLGNFVNRTLRFTERRFGATVPDGGAPGEAEEALARELGAALHEFDEQMAGAEFRKANATLRAIWTLGNTYIDRAAPWAAIKTDPDQAALALRTAINLIRVFALVSRPTIPATAELLLGHLGLDPADQPWPSAGDAAGELARLAAGHEFTVPEPLFRKVSDEDVEAWKARFGGVAAAPAAGGE